MTEPIPLIDDIGTNWDEVDECVVVREYICIFC